MRDNYFFNLYIYLFKFFYQIKCHLLHKYDFQIKIQNNCFIFHPKI